MLLTKIIKHIPYTTINNIQLSYIKRYRSYYFNRDLWNYHDTKYSILNSNIWLYHNVPYTKIGICNEKKDEIGKILDISFLNECGNYISIGEPLCEIIGTECKTKITLPFNCILLDVNNDINNVENLIDLNNNSKCNDKWLMKIELHEN
jgi:glycine cleavage system H lipoate-binding protein